MSDQPAEVTVQPLESTVVVVEQSTDVIVAAPQPSSVAIEETGRPLIRIGPSRSLVGWRFISDSLYTAQNPLQVLAGQRIPLPNNGFGTLSSSFGAPSASWYDKVNSRFHPDAVGDLFLYRVNMTVVPAVNNKKVYVDFDIGTPNKVTNDNKLMDQGAGLPKPISFLLQVAAGSSFLTNGGRIGLTCDTDAQIYGISVLVNKQFGLEP